MNEKTLKNLEFHKIINLLSNKCITFIGKEKASLLLPTSNIDMANVMQSETSEACSLILRKNFPPISPISDLKLISEKLDIGSILNIDELLRIATALKIFRELIEYFDKENIEIEFLAPYVDKLYSNKNVETEIFRCIKSDTELDDHASAELHKIRKQIADSESKIKEKLNSIIHAKDTSKFLQDAVVTFRNGRFVIPVKSEYKNEINGLVHDQSASGSTLFIEPTSVFNINNEIKELHLKEQREVERILGLLTQIVSPLTIDLLNSSDALGDIDFIFAKANLAFNMDAFKPTLNNHGYINLKKARHPLLDKNIVVPIDVWLGKDFNTLIITGPNTGGKTVTLKTVGLLTLMASSGLHIPAQESSELAIFDHIYSDIGDEQSIEQSLSTFSAHMTNIVNITNEICNNDLVLLDELGSGTDPVEGSSLARAILSYLHSFGARTIATTHYSELKTFAINTQGMENASCEFDFEKLRPTYKLLIGVPGRSNAFLISKKLGLSDKIIGDASSYISSETIKFEDVLTHLEQDKIKIKEQKEISDKMLADAQKLKAEATKIHDEISTKKSEIINKAKVEARDILTSAKQEANDIIKDLIEIKSTSSKDKFKQAENARAKISQSIKDLQKDLLSPQDVENSIDEKDIKVGMEVFVPTLDQNVVVISMPDKNKNITVQSGLMKLSLHISNVQNAKKVEEKKKIVRSTKSTSSLKTDALNYEVMLLGLTVDEAISKLEKYIDDAYISGLHEIRIVHGKGTGQLRKGVQDYLKHNPHIKSFRLGMYGEGDTGVTIAEIK